MRHPMMSVLEQNPVLPAVKDAGRLEACLAQPAGVVFLLCGDILNIDRLIDRVHQAGKYAVVHADLVAGLASREIAVDFLHRCGADGIISTRPMLLRRGRCGCSPLTPRPSAIWAGRRRAGCQTSLKFCRGHCARCYGG